MKSTCCHGGVLWTFCSQMKDFFQSLFNIGLVRMTSMCFLEV